MESIKRISEIMRDSIAAKEKVLNDGAMLEKIALCVKMFVECYRNGGRVFFAGNGGSAADAQHLAGELVSKFFIEREGIPSEALNCNTSILTAIGNDYSYDRIFARQLEANGKKGDLFVGLSTSGNSKNIIAALESCRKIGIGSIGMTGGGGGNMAGMCDVLIDVPSKVTPRVQETHITIGHIVCEITEAELFGEKK
ncbi:MAG: phosphoheptose isomerase [Spirochaetes bacterium GWF1_51_8]|nr:MAG: phosphoheptose isomerase [Spirochaetes bacterium GWF1_51_8]